MAQTMSDMMWQAMCCTTKDEADAWLQKTVDELLAADQTLIRERTRAVLLDNIGYTTGYVSREKAAQILDIFGTRHPYFGAIEDWPKTPEQTMATGFKAGIKDLPEPQRSRREAEGRKLFGEAWKP
jgi:hypothetical protein